jgi:hypothetical protein
MVTIKSNQGHNVNVDIPPCPAGQDPEDWEAHHLLMADDALDTIVPAATDDPYGPGLCGTQLSNEELQDQLRDILSAAPVRQSAPSPRPQVVAPTAGPKTAAVASQCPAASPHLGKPVPAAVIDGKALMACRELAKMPGVPPLPGQVIVDFSAVELPADIQQAYSLPMHEAVHALKERLGNAWDDFMRADVDLRPILLQSIMYCPAMWQDTPGKVRTWFQLYRRKMTPPVPQPGMVRRCIKLVLLSGCTGTGTPLIAVQEALQLATHAIGHQRVQFQIVRVLSWEKTLRIADLFWIWP